MGNLQKPSAKDRQRRADLSRWEKQCGARCDQIDTPHLTSAELVQLRVRVIALENLIIALLAAGSERTQTIVRELTAFISPRIGLTQHPLTLHVADHMIQLVARAVHFQAKKTS